MKFTKVDILRVVLGNLLFSILIFGLLLAVLIWFDYNFNIVIINSLLLWTANFLLKYSLQVRALKFDDSEELSWNLSKEYLIERENVFSKAHPKINYYNSVVVFMSVIVNIAIFLYLIVGLYIS